MKQRTKRPLFVVITGDIGSGKSIVTEFFKKRNYLIWSADSAIKELYKEANIADDIQKLLCQNIITNGRIDTKILREIVFSDPNNLNKLNNYIHPLVKNKLQTFMSKCITQCDDETVIFEIPLLFECNMEKSFDLNILITADQETKIERVINRDGCSRENAFQILKNQMPQEQKICKAEIIVQNNSDCNALNIQLELLEQTLKYIKKRII